MPVAPPSVAVTVPSVVVSPDVASVVAASVPPSPVPSVVAEETVEALVAAVFEELSRFRKMHPAFANLEPGAMIREGQFAPLHAGAESYYRAKGLM